MLAAALSALVGAGVVSCGSKGNETPQATPEQIEEAHVAGREAARVFVNRTWRDTLEMQEQLIEASVKGSEFDSVPVCRAAYDSAFISTVRTVRPDVAAELERMQRK